MLPSWLQDCLHKFIKVVVLNNNRCSPGEADSAISREGVGVQKDFGLRLQGVLHVHHRLVLQAGVLGEVVLVPLLVRAAILFIVPQVSQFLLDRLPLLRISLKKYSFNPHRPGKS